MEQKQEGLNRMTQEPLALLSYIQGLKARVRKLKEELAWTQREDTSSFNCLECFPKLCRCGGKQTVCGS